MRRWTRFDSAGSACIFGELVIRGARGRLSELDEMQNQEDRNAGLRRQLVDQLRTAEGLDADAAYEVRERGWSH